MFCFCFGRPICAGGIIYGWPGLSQQLKNSAQYADGCGPNYSPKETCPSQDNHLNNIFAVGANIATLSTIVYGFTLDRFGVRANAFSGALIMAAGFVLLALSDSHKMDAFIPGFAMVAFGGLGTYLPAFQFSALFSRPTLILSVQSALFGVAGLTFTFLKYLDESHGISRKTSFLFYAGLVLFCGLNMLLLYPANAYRKGDQIHLPVLGWLGIQKPPQEGLDAAVNGFGSEKIDADYSPLTDEDTSSVTKKLEVFAGDNGNGADSRGSPTSDVEATNGNTLAPSAGEIAMLRAERKVRDLTHAEKEAVKNARSLKDELLDPGTILVALHFSIGLLCCNMYNANISTVLKNMGDTDGKITNAFVFITSIYPCVFALAIDTLQRKYRYAGTSFLATLFLMSAHAHTRRTSRMHSEPARMDRREKSDGPLALALRRRSMLTFFFLYFFCPLPRPRPSPARQCRFLVRFHPQHLRADPCVLHFRHGPRAAHHGDVLVRCGGVPRRPLRPRHRLRHHHLRRHRPAATGAAEGAQRTGEQQFRLLHHRFHRRARATLLLFVVVPQGTRLSLCCACAAPRRAAMPGPHPTHTSPFSVRLLTSRRRGGGGGGENYVHIRQCWRRRASGGAKGCHRPLAPLLLPLPSWVLYVAAALGGA